MNLVLEARTPEIADLVKACAEKKITFQQLCDGVSALGYKTTSLHEMVTAEESLLERGPLQ